jgi:MOSC domain-containing protein YiiM
LSSTTEGSETARIVSVNVGRPRSVDYGGRLATSSIWKSPVVGPVRASGVNLEGDDQADREVHGGPDKAIYAYALEDLRFWEEELGRALEPGTFGENLTTSGIDWTLALIGERWQTGTVTLEVSQPRAPCWKLGMKMEDPAFLKRFTRAGRPGAYLRIVEEGALAAGDPIRALERPTHGVSVGDVFRIFSRDRGEAGRLLSVPELADDWKEWARAQVARWPERN